MVTLVSRALRGLENILAIQTTGVEIKKAYNTLLVSIKCRVRTKYQNNYYEIS